MRPPEPDQPFTLPPGYAPIEGEIHLSRISGKPDSPENAHLVLDKVDCAVCGNHGYRVWRDSNHVMHSRPCECSVARRNLWRIRLSGLESAMENLRFDNWLPEREAEDKAKRNAWDWAHNPQGWFYLGGGAGNGKTHLCTAICGQLLKANVPVRYWSWRNSETGAPAIKASVNDREEYERLLRPIRETKVLYIDDLFKTGRERDRFGNLQPMMPTAADINLAYEIINARYMRPDLLTIISTELTIGELSNIDEALGGRIYERAKGHTFTTTEWRDRRTTRSENQPGRSR